MPTYDATTVANRRATVRSLLSGCWDSLTALAEPLQGE